MADETQTISITNFSGRLSRILNGEMNSGFAKFANSWGYDPFSKPMNLTWLEQPVDITGPITDLPLAARTRFESGTTQYVYTVGSTGNLYKIQPNGSPASIAANVDSVVGIASVVAGGPGYNFGASMEFYGATQQIYVSNDNFVNKINFDGSGDTKIGNTPNWAQNTFKPLKVFAGELNVGHGNTIAQISANTMTVTSSIIGTGQGNLYSQLNPPLPVDSFIHDVETSIDGNYLLITASNINTEQIAAVSADMNNAESSNGYIYNWNGSDATVTAFTQIPSYAVTSLHTYLQNNVLFANDSFGASVNDGTNKLVSLPNNKPALPNAVCSNGNFLTWVAPEIDTNGTSSYATLWYFGSLDQENPAGLFRLMRFSPTVAGAGIYQCPLNILTNNKFYSLGSSGTPTIAGYGKHYISVSQLKSGLFTYNLLRFLVTSSGSGTPQLGVYETQTQMFSKKIQVKQVRIYTEPTASGNGFQVDLIGSDGAVLANGTKTYTFTAGNDTTLNQGALQRIALNFTSAPTYAVGVRFTNTGTTNMTIKKCEVDVVPQGK